MSNLINIFKNATIGDDEPMKIVVMINSPNLLKNISESSNNIFYSLLHYKNKINFPENVIFINKPEDISFNISFNGVIISSRIDYTGQGSVISFENHIPLMVIENEVRNEQIAPLKYITKINSKACFHFEVATSEDVAKSWRMNNAIIVTNNEWHTITEKLRRHVFIYE